MRFHHDWGRRDRFARASYDYGDHVLRSAATPLRPAAARLASQVHATVLDEVLALVPDAWLEPDADRPDPAAPANPAAARDAYRDTLLARLAAAESWLPALGS